MFWLEVSWNLPNYLSEPVTPQLASSMGSRWLSGLISETITWLFNAHLFLCQQLQSLPKLHLFSSYTMALAVPQTAASRLSKHTLPFARQQIPPSELLAPINLQDKDQVLFPESQVWFGLDTHLLWWHRMKTCPLVCVPVRLWELWGRACAVPLCFCSSLCLAHIDVHNCFQMS